MCNYNYLHHIKNFLQINGTTSFTPAEGRKINFVSQGDGEHAIIKIDHGESYNTSSAKELYDKIFEILRICNEEEETIYRIFYDY